MNLRFSARGEHPDAVVHLTAAENLRIGGIVRARGEALCRPHSSLPNLELLSVQLLGRRTCCFACIAVMERLRRKRPVSLPAAAGLTAAELIRGAQRTRKLPTVRGKIRLRRLATSAGETGAEC